MIQTTNHTERSIIYSDPLRSPHVNNYRSIENDVGRPRDWTPDDGKMSPSRRTFCLFTTFDLILTFILWVIYTQLIGKKGFQAFDDQVANYDFRTSLFDTVMIAAIRFTCILLAYALFRLCHWWVIAITTSMTCIYLLFKCFYFEFNDAFFGGKNPLSYILLIVCFILAWIETWFLDFKVIPVEKKARERASVLATSDSRTPLLSEERRPSSIASDFDQYYSPTHTPEGSDDEAEHRHYKSLPSSQTHSRTASNASNFSKASFYSEISQGDTEHYLRLCDEASVALWDMLHMDGWKLEAGKSLETGMIHGQHIKKYGRKIFRLQHDKGRIMRLSSISHSDDKYHFLSVRVKSGKLGQQGIIPMAPKECWTEMVTNLNESPRWNPTVIESRSLQSIDDITEVTYNIAAEAAGGLVSARDFISVRQWTQREGVYLSIGMGCTHPDMPQQKKYVRGENGPGGWSFQEVEGEPDQCLYTWIVNSSLKGWLPQAAIDQAMSGVLLEYFRLLLIHIEDVKTSR